jgi:hypothetical protein
VRLKSWSCKSGTVGRRKTYHRGNRQEAHTAGFSSATLVTRDCRGDAVGFATLRKAAVRQLAVLILPLDHGLIVEPLGATPLAYF